MKHLLKPQSRTIKALTNTEIVAGVKKAEKSRKLPYADFVKITETWKESFETEMIIGVKEAEKSKKIKWEDAKKMIEKW